MLEKKPEALSIDLPGVGAKQREAESQPLLQPRLQAVVVRSCASFLLSDLAEVRIARQVGVRAGRGWLMSRAASSLVPFDPT